MTPSLVEGYRPLPAADGTTILKQAFTAASAGALLPVGACGPVSQQAITAPATAPTPALAGAGAGNVDNGDHKYLVTFVTDVGETAPSALSAAVTVVDKAANGKVALTAIPTSIEGRFVYARKVYRTKIGAPSGTAYLLATIADNTTTTYTDNTADANLGAASVAATSADPAPSLHYPKAVVFTATKGCHVRTGVGAQVAVAGDKYVPPDVPVPYVVPDGHQQFAVIRDSADGDLFIEVTEWNVET